GVNHGSVTKPEFELFPQYYETAPANPVSSHKGNTANIQSISVLRNDLSTNFLDSPDHAMNTKHPPSFHLLCWVIIPASAFGLRFWTSAPESLSCLNLLDPHPG